ncbi:MAG TPA: universal stress protein [Steroidobacteraceae bacterium]|nr:universal stress protein [Steroidobacteraceae bacterium]
MYGKILVPVDGSDTALKGLNEAIKLAKTLGSAICLVHVVNEFIFDYSYSVGAYAGGLIDGLRERGKAIMADAAALVRAHGLEPSTVLLESIGGPAADLIVAQAAESHAELIVMGTHGRRGLRRMALGSDAEQVLRMASVPVLLVRNERPAAVTVPKAAAA